MTRAGRTLRVLCITVLGSGYAPFASGSWGSLVAVILFMPLWWGIGFGGADRVWIEVGLVVGVLISSVISVIWGRWAVEHFKRKDPKQFVLDEFAGQWVALLALPMVLTAPLPTLAWVIGGQFFLFRLFDVIKPPPARQLERLPDGWGILLDDLFAGLYANIVGQLVWRLTPAAAWLGISLSNT